MSMKKDSKTAEAFANSWNNLPLGSVYSDKQVQDWLLPLKEKDFKNKRVLELGCGNGSFLLHIINWEPLYLEGVDLGDSVISAKKNLEITHKKNWDIIQADLTEYKGKNFDIVYCIGVLHHLKDPKKGFDAVINNVKKNGKFHCWVYGKEGNALIIYFVDPLRKICCMLPWWYTKYCIATPLAILFFIYANLVAKFSFMKLTKLFPLYEYCLWISQREFSFFVHVSFDQLVTPQTNYIPKSTIQSWLRSCEYLEDWYIIQRNGNSWKFGGRVKK